MKKGWIALFSIALLLCSSQVMASTEHEPRWGDFAWRVLNLVLFCGILWYFVGGICKRFFRNRKQAIQDTLTELENRKAAARERLDEMEKRISGLEAERQAILEESQAQAQRLRQGILDDAQRQAEQIVEQARRTAENESRALLGQIRATVADEIVDAASKALAGKLTDAEHDRLIDNALDKVAL